MAINARMFTQFVVNSNNEISFYNVNKLTGDACININDSHKSVVEPKTQGTRAYTHTHTQIQKYDSPYINLNTDKTKLIFEGCMHT